MNFGNKDLLVNTVKFTRDRSPTFWERRAKIWVKIRYQDKSAQGQNPPIMHEKILMLVQVHWLLHSYISEMHLLVQPRIFFIHMNTENNS